MSAAIAPPALTGVTLDVDGYRVDLGIRLLAPDEHEAVAASMAWLAKMSLTDECMVDRLAWTTFVEDVLSPYVTFAVEVESPEPIAPAWWGEVIRRATMAFIQANDLGPSINRFLSTFDATGSQHRALS